MKTNSIIFPISETKSFKRNQLVASQLNNTTSNSSYFRYIITVICCLYFCTTSICVTFRMRDSFIQFRINRHTICNIIFFFYSDITIVTFEKRKKSFLPSTCENNSCIEFRVLVLDTGRRSTTSRSIIFYSPLFFSIKDYKQLAWLYIK
jgi:hypothetical protein